MAAALASSTVSARDLHPRYFSGYPVKMLRQPVATSALVRLHLHPGRSRKAISITGKNHVVVRAGLRDAGRPSGASIFVGGFVLGGILVGALGCIYAPQISKALAGTDRKDLMRKLPKFIYDEEKALEKTRRILAEKIKQLNSAIDDVSAQLRTDDAPNGAAVASDGIEAAI